MIFLFVFAAFCAAGYKLMKTEMVSSVYQLKKSASFYIAEAGVADAMQAIALNPSWTAGFAAKPFAGGFYSVEVDTNTSPATVSSKGWVAGGFALGDTVKTLIRVGFTTSPDLFRYALGGLGTPGNKVITLTDSTVNGSIYIEPEADVPLPEPAINEAALKTEAAAGGGCPAGSVLLSGVTVTLGPRCIENGDLSIVNSTITLTGTVYVGRDLLINNSYVTGMRTIFAGGNITVSNGSVVGSDLPNDSPFICTPVTGNSARVGIEDSSMLRTAVYAPNSRLDVLNSDISGSFVGGNSEYTNAGKPGIYGSTVTWTPVYYPGSMGENSPGVVPGSWEEVH
jgi:hypothetical protein